MTDTTTLAKFVAPLGRQEIELQQIHLTEGGMPLLRVRIREGKRFTIFDIDPVTARLWAEHMQAWSEQQVSAGARS